MSNETASGVPLSEHDATRIADLLHEVCGIRLRPGSESLLRSRLTTRIRALDLRDFGDYLRRVEADPTGREMSTLVDLMTTNKTEFWREPSHFEYLRDSALPGWLPERSRLRFWSAGCATGEEPYTLAMLLRESIPDIEERDVRILATDISETALSVARRGEYGAKKIDHLPEEWTRRYFTTQDETSERSYRVADCVTRMVSFAKLNLMQPWSLSGPFDVIFCRNVMIYFEPATQARLIDRLTALLAPGGYLFIGHSEFLTTTNPGLRFLMPATYVKSDSTVDACASDSAREVSRC